MPRSTVAFVAAGLALASAQNCFHDFGNSSFNLLPYQTQPNYKVRDSQNNNNSLNYEYWFNICKNVDPLTIYGSGPANNWKYPICNCTYGYGARSNGQDNACLQGNAGYVPDGGMDGPRAWAPAFQVALPKGRFTVPVPDQCHSLGAGLAPGNNPSQSYLLVDPSNPSRGVGIKYSGGDSCAQNGPSRSLTVWLQCEDDNSNKPDDEPVLETGSCAYEIFVKTLYGCPLECGGLTNGRLCTGHGICDYDTSVKSSRCFCNDGFSGDDCSISGAAGGSGLSALASVLIVVVIFLVGTLGFLGFLWYRIRSLRLDPAAYSALRAGPEESDKASLNAPAFSSA